MYNTRLRRIIRDRCSKRKSFGLINILINKLPVELHIPDYNFCGPGTKLTTRLQRGDKGVNLLDDIAYSKSDELSERHAADKQLYTAAINRFRSKDAGIGEKLTASTVTGIMKAKTKFGMGVKRRYRKPSRNMKKISKRGRI